MLLLGQELGIEILMLQEIALQPGDFNVARVESVFLCIKLRVEISVLLLSIDQEVLLVVDFLS